MCDMAAAVAASTAALASAMALAVEAAVAENVDTVVEMENSNICRRKLESLYASNMRVVRQQKTA